MTRHGQKTLTISHTTNRTNDDIELFIPFLILFAWLLFNHALSMKYLVEIPALYDSLFLVMFVVSEFLGCLGKTIFEIGNPVVWQYKPLNKAIFILAGL